jgi:hypothetical protein
MNSSNLFEILLLGVLASINLTTIQEWAASEEFPRSVDQASEIRQVLGELTGRLVVAYRGV